ncbi:MAG: DUF4266 domain-containing protein [Gammaproteobacteria bacterium]|nr:MAG: DUF4266 domain-containing protein [Gammaproteobacteria bacterium]
MKRKSRHCYVNKAILCQRLVVVLLMLGLSGCGLKPWVKPYERQNLADPIMSLNPDPVEAAYMQHVYEAREGARGGDGGGGGGCGCN